MTQMPPSAHSSNLNAKLSPPARDSRSRGSIGISWSASAIQASAPPVRIVGSARRYKGGFRLDF